MEIFPPEFFASAESEDIGYFSIQISASVGTTTRLLQEHWRTNLDDLIRLYKSYELLFYKIGDHSSPEA